MKLTRKDWEDAAYKELLEGGARAVTVMKLSDRLGSTRGSFYHYFDSRDELLASALAMWGDRATTAFIDSANRHSDPAQRLRRLFSQVFREPTDLTAAERHLAADRETEPLVETVVASVSMRRKQYLAECYRDLGFDEAASWDKALLAYMMFIGWLNLDEMQSGDLPEHAASLASQVVGILLPNQEPEDSKSTVQ